jgi:hypothetical protein
VSKLFQVWQPVETEDARTALVFEFLRHAPAEHGLDAWLSRALRRPVSVKGLEVDDFWPSTAMSSSARSLSAVVL